MHNKTILALAAALAGGMMLSGTAMAGAPVAGDTSINVQLTADEEAHVGRADANTALEGLHEAFKQDAGLVNEGDNGHGGPNPNGPVTND